MNQPTSIKPRNRLCGTRNKIFVGNVPYQCTKEEFENCFAHIDGFVKAEIITKYRTSESRGFGFITMANQEDADKLQENNIVFKNRVLRFTPYRPNSAQIVDDYSNNYVFVDNVPFGSTRRWLKQAFAEYEPIGKCFVAIDHKTGQFDGTGFVEIIDDTLYRRALDKKTHTVIYKDSTVQLNVLRYRVRFKRRRNQPL